MARGDDGAVKPRSSSKWSRDEQLRLLCAWRDVLLQLSTLSSDSPSAPRPQEALEADEVDARMFERFMELSRDVPDAPERRETSMTRKRQALMRTFVHMVEYNAQQGKRSHTGTNNKRKKQRPAVNHWFALTAEQQQRVMARYLRGSFVEIDEEMFAILAVIDKAEKARKERITGLRVRNVLWTKGEVWVLINAWRRVIESRPKTRDQNSHIITLVSKQFDAQTKSGMPMRSKQSVKAKLSALTTLYRLISEFNQQRSGPHEVDQSVDWFLSSEEIQAEFISSRSARQYKFAELDQDTFNAMEMIMKYEDSLEAGASGCRGARNNTRQRVIDISSDGEHDESDWEIVPVTTSSGHERTPDAPEDQASARPSHHHPLRATHHHQHVNITELFDSEDESSTTTARKRAKADAELPSASQTQVFNELLAKLKRERKADKAKRRKERAERKELLKLISQERDERLRDREERQKERQEWELERDQLKFKLKKMRERYKKATKKLKSS